MPSSEVGRTRRTLLVVPGQAWRHWEIDTASAGGRRRQPRVGNHQRFEQKSRGTRVRATARVRECRIAERDPAIGAADAVVGAAAAVAAAASCIAALAPGAVHRAGSAVATDAAPASTGSDTTVRWLTPSRSPTAPGESAVEHLELGAALARGSSGEVLMVHATTAIAKAKSRRIIGRSRPTGALLHDPATIGVDDEQVVVSVGRRTRRGTCLPAASRTRPAETEYLIVAAGAGSEVSHVDRLEREAHAVVSLAFAGIWLMVLTSFRHPQVGRRQRFDLRGVAGRQRDVEVVNERLCCGADVHRNDIGRRRRRGGPRSGTGRRPADCWAWAWADERAQRRRGWARRWRGRGTAAGGSEACASERARMAHVGRAAGERHGAKQREKKGPPAISHRRRVRPLRTPRRGYPQGERRAGDCRSLGERAANARLGAVQTLLEIMIPIVVLAGAGGAFFVRSSRRRIGRRRRNRPASRRDPAAEAGEPLRLRRARRSPAAVTRPKASSSPTSPKLPNLRPVGSSGCAHGLRGRNPPSAEGCSRLLSRDTLDDETWQEVEDLLLTADVGVSAEQRARRLAQDQGEGARHEVGCRCQGIPARRAPRTRRPRPRPHAGDAAPSRRRSGDRARGRCQRHRQDDDVRQDRPTARRRRPNRGARRRRHIPSRGGRPARDVGTSSRRADRSWPRGRRPGIGRIRCGEDRHRRSASTPCSSTRPVACTPRRA